MRRDIIQDISTLSSPLLNRINSIKPTREKPMTDLFDATYLKSMRLPNRSFRSATWSGISDEKGYITELGLEFYSTLGGGGIGAIITGYQYVMKNGIQLPFQTGNYDDSQIDGLTKLASNAKANGSAVIGQIVHCGVRPNRELFWDGGDIWGPSAIPDVVSGVTPVEVDKYRIRDLLEAYADAARRLKSAGFDGVQLHGAHGYGINQFLSETWNRRGDAYGGNLRKRYRFLAEALEAVRGSVGSDFPVLIKLNACDFVDGGLTPEESLQVAGWLSEDGIDAIEISAGGAAAPKNSGPIRLNIVKREDEAYFRDYAKMTKQSAGVPVITVGGIRSYQTVTDILDNGDADYVSFSRPFIREPGLINRWKNGDKSAATCISCGKCFETGLKGLGISCKIDRDSKSKR